MFIGGCGKFFEGTAAEMYPSLYEKIATLPNETVVWPGHEVYTHYIYSHVISTDNGGSAGGGEGVIYYL
jgi:glyoxylase-like metal-dependent hydrolase (beta-lactamase superfamily II)